MPVENENIDFWGDIFETAPLDLLIGHLRTVDSNYRELKDYAFAELKNWYSPVGWIASGNEMVATIQPFKTGGYEVTVKNVDMQSFGNLMSSKGRGGARKGKSIPVLSPVLDSALVGGLEKAVEGHNESVDSHDLELCCSPNCVLCSLESSKADKSNAVVGSLVCNHGFNVSSCSWCTPPELYSDSDSDSDSESNSVISNKREKGETNENDKIRSAQRAKKKVRQLIKQKGCDRLLTLTRRENNPDTFKTEDEWLEDWRKFVRLCRIAGIELEYVTTLEKHKKGNFHLHAAIVGKVHINTIRKIWLQVVGAGQGNVDISFKQHQTPTQRLAGVARYVSKYITKQLDNFDFNRKRYWASRSEPLEKPKKIILSAKDMAGALVEIAGVLSLDLDVLTKKVFLYGQKAGERAGAWFNYDESMQLEIPF